MESISSRSWNPAVPPPPEKVTRTDSPSPDNVDRISLTTFVDFVVKAGGPKFTVLQNWKQRGEYDPAADFYKPMREKLISTLRRGESLDSLGAWAATLKDEKKRKAYADLLTGLRKWRGRKVLHWFDPPSGIWSHGPVQVRVNPELGLIVGGTPYVIKLFLKDEPLPKNRAIVILQLMLEGCAGKLPPGGNVAILHVRSGRLISSNGYHLQSALLLRGEAAYWAAVWPDA